jgi:hypothetical protein
VALLSFALCDREGGVGDLAGERFLGDGLRGDLERDRESDPERPDLDLERDLDLESERDLDDLERDLDFDRDFDLDDLW